jgi:hypothetical protein
MIRAMLDTVVNALFAMGGVLVVSWVLWDVYQTVVIPRATPTRIRLARYVTRGLWAVGRWRANRATSSDRRERLLGNFAPFTVVVLLGLWVALLVLGFGLILYGLRAEIDNENDLGTALYQSGISLLTIGYGDVLARGVLSRLTEIAAAATGVAVLGLGVTYLFMLYGAFQRREELVTTLDARAGAPPSGIQMLETYAEMELWDDMRRTFSDWEEWSARVLDSHVAYPILSFFRSSHDGESWLGAIGAVLDAAVLLATTVESGPRGQAVPRGQAIMTIKLGSHLVEDVAQFFGFADTDQPMVTRAEFNAARYRLARAGMAIRSDGELSWTAFSELRAGYASRLNALATYLLIPPTQWIGDRSSVRHIGRVDEVVRVAAQAGREAAARSLLSRQMPQIEILDGPEGSEGPVITVGAGPAIASDGSALGAPPTEL